MFKDEINSYELERFFKELLSRKGQVTDTKYVGDIIFHKFKWTCNLIVQITENCFTHNPY